MVSGGGSFIWISALGNGFCGKQLPEGRHRHRRAGKITSEVSGAEGAESARTLKGRVWTELISTAASDQSDSHHSWCAGCFF